MKTGCGSELLKKYFGISLTLHYLYAYSAVKIGCGSEMLKKYFGISLTLHYLCNFR